MGILRDIFGPSRVEIWSQLAADIGGEFHDRGWLRDDAVTYRHGQWELVLDTTHHSKTTFTRMRAPFVNKDGFRFAISRENLFSPLGRWLGMQDIEIGDPDFDRDYVIKATDQHQIRRLLADEELRQRFQRRPKLEIEVRDDDGWFGSSRFPEGCDQLHCELHGVIKDVHQLKDLFDCFARILERLVAIDSAYETDPGIDLLA